MARMPIELALLGRAEAQAVTRALALANGLQTEFEYTRLAPGEEGRFAMLAFDKVHAPTLLDSLDRLRNEIRGFHPYLVAILDAPVDGDDYSNLFGSSRAEAGIGILTSAGVPDIVVPRAQMVAYYLYYLARYAHCFIAPHHKNHEDSRGCIYDRKVYKPDLLKSMRAGAFCDDCRRRLISGDRPLSATQFSSLEALFEECGRIIRDDNPATLQHRPRLFIGSSTEGLRVARKIQASLADEYAVEIWNQGNVFGLGTGTLEALESAVDNYDFGVFVFSPDDELVTRGQARSVARDNVIFELGLFAGRLGRRRAFVVRPRSEDISLPTDLAGVSTAAYDSHAQSLAAGVEPACEKIREAIALANQPLQPAGSARG